MTDDSVGKQEIIIYSPRFKAWIPDSLFRREKGRLEPCFPPRHPVIAGFSDRIKHLFLFLVINCGRIHQMY